MLVRCEECGLLAVRNIDDSSVYPADEKLRRDGTLQTRTFPGDREPSRAVGLIHRSDELICFIGREELIRLRPGQNCLVAIKSEHSCPRAMKWIPGRSPEQHLQMYELERQQEHNDRMLAEERAWREQQAQAERDWRERDREAREREAQRAEARHQKDFQAANSRFWLGFALAIGVTVIGHVVTVFIDRTIPSPAKGVESTAAERAGR